MCFAAAELEAIEEGARKSPRSPCVVLYLVCYKAAPFAKNRVSMKSFAKRQVVPELAEHTNSARDVAVGDLLLKGFPG